MSILNEKLQVKELPYYRANDLNRSPLLEFKNEETGETRPGMDKNEQYRMQVVLGMNFWANKAQYSQAASNVKKVLLRRIYRDTLSLLGELRKSIFDGDGSAALAWCEKIERDLLDDD